MFLKCRLASTHRHPRPEDPHLPTSSCPLPPAAPTLSALTLSALMLSALTLSTLTLSALTLTALMLGALTLDWWEGLGWSRSQVGLLRPDQKSHRDWWPPNHIPSPRRLLPPVLSPPCPPLGLHAHAVLCHRSARWPTVAVALPQCPGTRAPSAQRPRVPEQAGGHVLPVWVGETEGLSETSPAGPGVAPSVLIHPGRARSCGHIYPTGGWRTCPRTGPHRPSRRPLSSARPSVLCSLPRFLHPTGCPGFAGGADPSPHPLPPGVPTGAMFPDSLALPGPLPLGGCWLVEEKSQGGWSGAKASPPEDPGRRERREGRSPLHCMSMGRGLQGQRQPAPSVAGAGQRGLGRVRPEQAGPGVDGGVTRQAPHLSGRPQGVWGRGEAEAPLGHEAAADLPQPFQLQTPDVWPQLSGMSCPWRELPRRMDRAQERGPRQVAGGPDASLAQACILGGRLREAAVGSRA